MAGPNDDEISLQAEVRLATRRAAMRRQTEARPKALLYHPNETVASSLADMIKQATGVEPVACANLDEANDILAGKPDAAGQRHIINLIVSNYSIPFDENKIIQSAIFNMHVPILLTTEDLNTHELFDNSAVKVPYFNNSSIDVPYVAIPVQPAELGRQIAAAQADPTICRINLLRSFLRLDAHLANNPDLLEKRNPGTITPVAERADIELEPPNRTPGASILLIESDAKVREATVARLKDFGYDDIVAPEINPRDPISVNKLLSDNYRKNTYPHVAVVDLGLYYENGGLFSHGLRVSSELLKYGTEVVLTSALPGVEHELPVLPKGYAFATLAANIEAAINDGGNLISAARNGVEKMLNPNRPSDIDALAKLRRNNGQELTS